MHEVRYNASAISRALNTYEKITRARSGACALFHRALVSTFTKLVLSMKYCDLQMVLEREGTTASKRERSVPLLVSLVCWLPWTDCTQLPSGWHARPCECGPRPTMLRPVEPNIAALCRRQCCSDCCHSGYTTMMPQIKQQNLDRHLAPIRAPYTQMNAESPRTPK